VVDQRSLTDEADPHIARSGALIDVALRVDDDRYGGLFLDTLLGGNP